MDNGLLTLSLVVLRQDLARNLELDKKHKLGKHQRLKTASHTQKRRLFLPA